jgi:hypothetical protein
VLILPLPVTVVRDGWDWLIVWCTVGATALAALAIWFAVVSIRRADRIAREDREAAVGERRNVFELGVLARLMEICRAEPARGSPDPAGAAGGAPGGGPAGPPGPGRRGQGAEQ